jgi:predicted RNA binding protein YcfA (HicA-like mRNA interferase family)
MNYDQLAKRLQELGCQYVRSGKGSHTFWRNPATNMITVIPDHGRKDLALGTVRAIIRQLGLSRDDFGSIR